MLPPLQARTSFFHRASFFLRLQHPDACEETCPSSSNNSNSPNSDRHSSSLDNNDSRVQEPTTDAEEEAMQLASNLK